MPDFVIALLSGVLHLGIVSMTLGPIIWWTNRRSDTPVLGANASFSLAAAAVIYLGSHVLLSLPRVGPFADLQWNWQNKILLFAVLLGLVGGMRVLTWDDVGLRMPSAGWLRPVLMVIAGTLGFQLLAGPMGDMPANAETVAFQAIVPGLDEELLFRGILLALIDRALLPRRRMWGGSVGWSAVITTVLFGFVHGFGIDSDFAIVFDPAGIIFTGLIGVLLVWVRTLGNSIVPAILLHNGINTSVVLATALSG